MIEDRLIEQLQQCEKVVALTGAGISAESGIATFRDAQSGVWAKYDPMELASPQGFRQNPERVWRWYGDRRAQIVTCEPNAAHLALVELATLVPQLTIITQNVDNLHQRAGSRDILALHGNIFKIICSRCGIAADQFVNSVELPVCPECGGYLRPDVVWFGENLAFDVLQAAESICRQCDVLFSIGTSSLVAPASMLPFMIPDDALLVEINPQTTPLTEHADYAIGAPATAALSEIVRRLADANQSAESMIGR